MLKSTSVPGTGTNFMPKEFTNGLSLVALGLIVVGSAVFGSCGAAPFCAIAIKRQRSKQTEIAISLFMLKVPTEIVRGNNYFLNRHPMTYIPPISAM